MSDETPSDCSSPHPGWARPRSPLPPHRLAKLANALGVSTPIPAYPSHLMINTLNPSTSPYPDHFRRSPTPSTASNTSFSSYPSATSKYLLHVIPPDFLPHDTDGSELTPPPPNASGYHAQFRRGTLVPMHATLQSQLGVIAKEYALPSATGMILYLVQPGRSLPGQISSKESNGIDTDEQGPRLSDEIWKHLWNRVLQAEREENARGQTSPISSLGVGVVARSPSCSPPEFIDRHQLPSIRPLEIAQPRAYPFTPSPTTPSSISDIRSQSKSAPPSSSSISQSDPPTPDTSSLSPSYQADQFDLPGLYNPSFVPVLAKVEFDIDRRKAGWFEPWLRSRRTNHAKRANISQITAKDKEGTSDTVKDKNALLGLKLVGRLPTASPAPSFTFSVSRDQECESDSEPQAAGYGLLSESPEGTDPESGDDCHGESITRVTRTANDPLEDIFGADADTWADIRASSKQQRRRQDNPKIVNLALNADDLALPSEQSSLESAGREEDEVEILLEAMSSSTPSTAKKHIPPPLIIQPHLADMVVSTSPLPPSTSGSINPPSPHPPEVRPDDKDSLFVPSGDPLVITRTPLDERREGGVYDDFDLGLDALGEVDPDERASQQLMKTRLDAIEKALAQLSPRRFKTDLPEEDSAKTDQPVSSSHPEDDEKDQSVSSPDPTASPGPEVSSLDSAQTQVDSEPTLSQPPDLAAKPAIPSFSLVTIDPSRSRGAGLSSSPPRAVPKDISVVPSASHTSHSRSSPSQPEEHMQSTEPQFAMQETLYPPLRSPIPPTSVIPLSPDPFSRYPSSVTGASSPKQSATYMTNRADPPPPETSQHRRVSVQNRADEGRQSDTKSSRFSADSITEETPSSKSTNRITLINVKSIKKLWRKSNKSSVSVSRPAPVPEGPSSLLSPPPLTPPPYALSEGRSLTVDTSSLKPSRLSTPLTPAPSVLSERSPLTPDTPSMKPSPLDTQHRVNSFQDNLHFNQESPYPVRRSAVQSISPNPPPPLVEGGEKDKSVRKSILKSWKSPIGTSPNTGSFPEPRPATERQGPLKGKRPSMMAFASGRASLSSPDIPPSPKIPQQFINPRSSGDKRQSIRSKLSMESDYQRTLPPRSHSVASSRASGDTRVSVDVSQFEIVSPKMSNLSYPYDGIVQQ